MVRITDNEDSAPGKPRVYEIVVENLSLSGGKWKATYHHVIRNEGYDEFAKKYGDYL